MITNAGEEEAVIRSYRFERVACSAANTVPAFIAGPITIKPRSLQFSGTRVSFTVVNEQKTTENNVYCYPLAKSIYLQCQTLEKTIAPLLGVPVTVTVEPVGFRCGEPDDSETGRRMLLGRGESASRDTSSCSVSAASLISIPDFYGGEARSLFACESENSKVMPGDPKQVFVYILADCMSKDFNNVDELAGLAVQKVLLEKIDWDSYGFTLHNRSSPPKLSKVSKARSGGSHEHKLTIIQVLSIPLRPVQPESQCALELIAIRISVNGAKSKKMKSLITLIKNAVNGALNDVKRSCPTAAMASGRERSIARAVPILSRSLLTSILGGGSATTFRNEEEFQSRIFEVLSVALSDK
jgi:hypothetical protein